MAGSYMFILLVTSLLTVDDIIASKLLSQLFTKKIEQPTKDNMDNVHRNLAGQHRFDEQKLTKKGDLTEGQNHAELRKRITIWPFVSSFIGTLIDNSNADIPIFQEKTPHHQTWQFVLAGKRSSTLSREKKVLQLEDNLERETNVRADVENVNRKLEQDLKSTQEAVKDKQRVKRDLEENIRKKNNDRRNNRLEEDLVALYKLRIMKLQSTIEKMEAKVEIKRQALAELETNLVRTKKARAIVEKAMRKLEQDLKSSQEAVEDKERVKRDLEENIRKKHNDRKNMNSRTEDEQVLVAQLQRKIKELQARIEELEEELETERQARAKAAIQRDELCRELDDLADEAGGATSAQFELQKYREHELLKLRHELEELTRLSETMIASFRKKQQYAANEDGDATIR